MFCHKCGGQVSEGAAFCPRCGTPVSGRAQAQPQPQRPQQAQPAQQVARPQQVAAHQQGQQQAQPAQPQQRPAQQVERQQPTRPQQVAQQPTQAPRQPQPRVAQHARPQQLARQGQAQQPASPQPNPQGAPFASAKPAAGHGGGQTYHILRFAEVAVAALLAVAAPFLPIVNVGIVSLNRDMSAIDIIRGAGQLDSIGFSDAPLLIFATVALLVVGVGSALACVLMCLLQPERKKVNPASWGMVVFAVGAFVAQRVVNAQIMQLVGELTQGLGVDGLTAGVDLLHAGLGIWVCLAGGIACGVLDLVRSRNA